MENANASEERIYNLFAFIEDGLLVRVGIVPHKVYGTDAEKMALLQQHVEGDFAQAIIGTLQKPISERRYKSMVRLGTALELFEELLSYVDAPAEPFMCVTAIVDGQAMIDATVESFGLIDLSMLPDALTGPGKMEDYLVKYMVGKSFDMPKLINDDYFLAIKLLFNAGYYVSATKLLMSFLDTVAFIETGNVRGNFVPWLALYADLSAVGITAEELWEMRNGLLHMTNLDSQKVLKGKHARLMPYIGEKNIPFSPNQAIKLFNLVSLLEVVASAIEAWMITYRYTPSKMEDFISRYDLILSDSRFGVAVSGAEEH